MTSTTRLTHPMSRVAALKPLLAMARPSHLMLIGALFFAGAFAAMATVAIDDLLGELLALSVGLAALLAVSASVHLANEAADEGTDARTDRTRFSGGSGALGRAGLPARLPFLVGLTAAAGGLAIGTAGALLDILPVPAWALLVCGTISGWAYSIPPLKLSHRGLGELDNALVGGLLLPLYGFAVTAGTVTPLAVVAFVPFALTDLANVVATAWPDRRADATVGKRTLAVRLPATTLRWLHAAVSVAAGAAILAAVRFVPGIYLLPTLAVLPFLGWAAIRFTRQESPAPAVAAMLAHATALLVGWAAATLG